MAVTATPIFPQSLLSKPTQLSNATSIVTPTSILAAQTNGAKIEKILVSSTDTSARDVSVFLQVAAVNYLLGTVSIPINSGNTNALPTVDILSALVATVKQLPLAVDANGNPYLYLDPSTSLFILPLTTITAGKFINVHVQGGAF